MGPRDRCSGATVASIRLQERSGRAPRQPQGRSGMSQDGPNGALGGSETASRALREASGRPKSTPGGLKTQDRSSSLLDVPPFPSLPLSAPISATLSLISLSRFPRAALPHIAYPLSPGGLPLRSRSAWEPSSAGEEQFIAATPPLRKHNDAYHAFDSVFPDIFSFGSIRMFSTDQSTAKSYHYHTTLMLP